jgi:hypothetical protein
MIRKQIHMRIKAGRIKIQIPDDLGLANMVLTGEHQSHESCLDRSSGCRTVCSGTLFGEQGKGLTYQIDWDESHGPPHWNLRFVPRVQIPGKYMKARDEITERLPQEKTHIYGEELEFVIEDDDNREIFRKKFIRGTTVSGTEEMVGSGLELSVL